MTSSEASAIDLRYPIGRFDSSIPVTSEHVEEALADMSRLPAALYAAVRGLTPEQLEIPHRVGGWCPRQIAHHIPDSHMNGYMRMKLALTETNPTVKPYNEATWAELLDARTMPPEVSLTLLEVLHQRWVTTLRGSERGRGRGGA